MRTNHPQPEGQWRPEKVETEPEALREQRQIVSDEEWDDWQWQEDKRRPMSFEDDGA